MSYQFSYSEIRDVITGRIEFLEKKNVLTDEECILKALKSLRDLNNRKVNELLDDIDEKDIDNFIKNKKTKKVRLLYYFFSGLTDATLISMSAKLREQKDFDFKNFYFFKEIIRAKTSHYDVGAMKWSNVALFISIFLFFCSVSFVAYDTGNLLINQKTAITNNPIPTPISEADDKPVNNKVWKGLTQDLLAKISDKKGKDMAEKLMLSLEKEIRHNDTLHTELLAHRQDVILRTSNIIKRIIAYDSSDKVSKYLRSLSVTISKMKDTYSTDIVNLRKSMSSGDAVSKNKLAKDIKTMQDKRAVMTIMNVVVAQLLAISE